MKRKDNNLMLGIIGAVIGAFIGSIPWIFAYVYLEMIFSLLAIVIAMAANYGYRKLGGPIDKKTPWIIAVTSMVSVILATTIFIPLLLASKEFGTMSIEMLKHLYSFSEFKSAIIQDLIVSILFTILGIAGIINNLKKETGTYKKGKTVDFANSDIEEVKGIFRNRNAFTKETSLSETDIAEITSNPDLNASFKYLKSVHAIKKTKEGYYLSE